MKPTLLVLAAGLGSRYGGLKQLDRLGPSGETIMDYSIYDAMSAGFGKVVFIIREDFHKEFNEVILTKYTEKIPCETCIQSVERVPVGFAVPKERTRPWGTNHAILMAKEIIHEPFCVINADDFYGKESFQIIGQELHALEKCHDTYCMVGYRIGKTLSPNGSVNRGVCTLNSEGYLSHIEEITNIEWSGTTVKYTVGGTEYFLDTETPVSMNMWGFTPEYFNYAEDGFKAFLQEKGTDVRAEFYIPTLVNELIEAGKITCKVLDTPSTWFGVTYPDDRAQVISRLQELIHKGIYPTKLF